ncbi:MAG: acetyltransferase [Terriglobales bacterium]|jgi:sugar O-acyltransferase (sialic acid O-acetyltransferase NeuD family)
MARVFVYGASGHGKVVADILTVQGIAVEGFIDDGPREDNEKVLGLGVLGDGHWLEATARREPVDVALGIGDNFARRRVARRLLYGIQLLTVVHPAATIARSAHLGAGAVVMAGSVVNPDAKIGTGAIINTGAIVEHDCQVGEFAHLSPHAAMGGCARLGECSWLGIGAVIIHNVAVGDYAIVGAGAAVIRDLDDGVIAVGVPARIVKKQFGFEK